MSIFSAGLSHQPMESDVKTESLILDPLALHDTYKTSILKYTLTKGNVNVQSNVKGVIHYILILLSSFMYLRFSFW